MINLQQLNYADNTCNGRRLMSCGKNTAKSANFGTRIQGTYPSNVYDFMIQDDNFLSLEHDFYLTTAVYTTLK